jgi:biotin operon repressor
MADRIPPRAMSPVEREKRRLEVSTLLLDRTPIGRIAVVLGVSRQTVSADVKVIRGEWGKDRREAYAQYAAEDLARLAALEKALWRAAMQGQCQAVDRCLAILAQRSRLLGLDAPARSTVTVLTEDVVDAEIKRLEAELAERRRP